MYGFLLIIVAVLVSRGVPGGYWWLPYVLTALVAGSLGRYLSTRYWIDDQYLHAWRLLGGVRIRLDRVRRIEYVSLRDLSPGGMFGSWGWRGRMWSPRIGHFDSIYTDAARGVLVTAGEVPLYVSPRNREAFARELSRRVRSYSGRLTVDVGDPLQAAGAPSQI